jgi:TonB-linked SusC/RagA family outer membrane protein
MTHNETMFSFKHFVQPKRIRFMKNCNRRLLLMKIFNTLLLLAFVLLYGGIAYAGTGLMNQPVTVTGTVVDEGGLPIPGANVIEKGTLNGTMTDASGAFTLTVASGEAVLQISYISFVSREIPIQGRTTLAITLIEDITQLDEVVVVGYGVQRKITVTGSISSVQSEDLVRSPQASVANTLAGRVTGLTSVQYSGQPGADDPILNVRGIGSLTQAASAPLVLVDGVERPFTQLDPNEIESITVLKDASATSVYGIKGANGVIIVTTKRGTESPLRVSFSTSTGMQVPTKLVEMADSYTWASLYNEAQLNDTPGATPQFSDFMLEKYKNQDEPLIYPNYDILDFALKPSALQTQQNINFSGGTKQVKYFLSLGHLFQDGLFRNYDTDYDWNYKYSRYNYRANVDVDVTKTTKLGLSIGGRTEDRNRPNEQVGDQPLRWFFAQVPFSTPGIVDGKRIQTASRYHGLEVSTDGLASLYGRGYSNNVNNVLNLDLNLNQGLDFITKGLQFRGKFSYNSFYTHNKLRSTSSAYYEAWYRTDVDPSAVGDSTIVFRKSGTDGILGYGESFGRNRDWYMEGGLTYDRSFDNHNVTALLLYNQSKRYYPGQLPGIPLGYVGIVGRVTYDFRSKYMAEFNLGYNGSENFAPGKRFGLFPSFSGGWVVSEESFMRDVNVITFLKLRASYGIVGNDRLGGARFLYLPDSYTASAGGYNFGTDNPQNSIIAAELRVGNPNVTWEKAKKQNYGLEMRMLKGKLGLNADYFYEYRDNILTTRNTVPNLIALTLPAVNIGVVENRGYEVELSWRDNIGNVNYFIRPNMSFARNKVIYMDEIPPVEDYLTRTGLSVNQPFVYMTDGFWTAEDIARIDEFPDHQMTPIPGAWKFQDLNGDGIINQDDRMAYGYPDYPEYIFSATLGFNFKGFDLSMLWTGVTNVSRQLFINSYLLNPFGPGNNQSLLQYMVDDRWTPETASTANFPSFSHILNGTNGSNMRASDWNLRDASYIRLKNAEVGYTFSINALQRFGVSSLRIYANGFNLFTFDRLKITDPESKTGDLDPFYPLIQIYNFGLNVRF